MGRGEATRKRINRQLRAQIEKHKLNPSLLLRPNKNGKQRSKEEDGHVPSSLRKMWRLQALADGMEKNKCTREPAIPARCKPCDETGVVDISSIRVRDTKSTFQRKEVVPSKSSSLKDKKRAFLSRKKKRKKPAGQGNDTPDPEKKMAAIAMLTRPSVGEQVDRPLDANLKRRHWSDRKARASSNRCADVFKKQMMRAVKAQSEGGPSQEKIRELAAAYREQKQPGKSTSTTATLASLAKLARKEMGI